MQDFRVPWLHSRYSRQLPFMVFSDFLFPGNGIGGTGNYNTFIDANENSDANATLTKIYGRHEIAARIRLDEALPE